MTRTGACRGRPSAVLPTPDSITKTRLTLELHDLPSRDQLLRSSSCPEVVTVTNGSSKAISDNASP